MTRAYEIMIVISPESDEETIDGVVSKCKDIIETREGNVIDVNKWGRRKLAYEVEDFTEGFYMLINFSGTSAIGEELERVLKLSEQVIRYLIVRQED